MRTGMRASCAGSRPGFTGEVGGSARAAVGISSSNPRMIWRVMETSSLLAAATRRLPARWSAERDSAPGISQFAACQPFQDGPEARQVDWLGHVVVHTGIKASLLVALHGVRCQSDDRHMPPSALLGAANGRSGLQTVDNR